MKAALRRVWYHLRYRGITAWTGATIGGNVQHGSHVVLCHGAAIHGVAIGSHAYVGEHTRVQYATIGSFVSIGADVRIGLGKHPINMVSTYPSFYASHASAAVPMARNVSIQEYERIEIGSDVWIGARAIVMDGVKVGHGSVIAAGAVVTKDVGPYAIVGGVPARVIRYRFAPEVIADLLAIAWWDWPEDLIRERSEDFADPKLFVERYRVDKPDS